MYIHYLSYEYFLVILGWFVEPEIVDAAMNGQLIAEEEVEVQPEKVSISCLDENVCLVLWYVIAHAQRALIRIFEVISRHVA